MVLGQDVKRWSDGRIETVPVLRRESTNPIYRKWEWSYGLHLKYDHEKQTRICDVFEMRNYDTEKFPCVQSD